MQQQKKKKNSNTYDIIIVGAGIAGFTVATELLRRRKGLRVALADRYKFLGGRTFTFQEDISGVHYQWEEGAARISERHTGVLALAKRHGLHWVPIGGETLWAPGGGVLEPNSFEAGALPILFAPLRSLPQATLASSTLRDLLVQLHGPKLVDGILEFYPYRAELRVMRADMALQLFEHEFSGQERYGILREGFSELIRRMQAEFEAAGGVVLPQHECIDCSGGRVTFRKGPPSKGLGREEVTLAGRATVLAVPRDALAKLVRRPWPLLDRLRMEPLLRLFAVFPVPAGGKAWFADLGKVVSPLPFRFLIPNDAATGSCQISYTDSVDAVPLIQKLEADGEDALGAFIVEQLRTAFGPGKTIPDPLFFKAHKWASGVTYWLPGDYDPVAESRKAARPFPKEEPGLFVCGESVSTRQCWAEGAVEHAHLMLDGLLEYLKKSSS